MQISVISSDTRHECIILIGKKYDSNHSETAAFLKSRKLSGIHSLVSQTRYPFFPCLDLDPPYSKSIQQKHEEHTTQDNGIFQLKQRSLKVHNSGLFRPMIRNSCLCDIMFQWLCFTNQTESIKCYCVSVQSSTVYIGCCLCHQYL